MFCVHHKQSIYLSLDFIKKISSLLADSVRFLICLVLDLSWINVKKLVSSLSLSCQNTFVNIYRFISHLGHAEDYISLHRFHILGNIIRSNLSGSDLYTACINKKHGYQVLLKKALWEASLRCNRLTDGQCYMNFPVDADPEYIHSWKN